MEIITDLKYSLRLLRKTPSFTAITLSIIVLGMSLYITSYSVVQVMTDKPMPFEDGDRYVTLKTQYTINNLDLPFNNYDYYSYNQLLARTDSYTVLGSFTDSRFTLSDNDNSSSYTGSFITPEMIPATKVNPILGRVFTAEDSVSGAPLVALIGYAIWQDYYGGSTDILGKTSMIDGQLHSIIGVMPEGFRFPFNYDLWLPLPSQSSLLPGEGLPLSLMGILKENTSHAAAETELNALMAQLAVEYPENYTNRVELVRPVASMISSDTVALSTMIGVVTIIILALAIINLSSLLFIRSSSRQQELAVRASLGASGWNLAKQILLESLIICVFGLMVSLLLAGIMLRILNSLFLNSMNSPPFWFDLKLDMQALSIGVVCTLIVWLASSMVTAYKTYRNKPFAILNSANKGTMRSGGNAYTTRLIVCAEVIMSCFLLICCGVIIYLVQLVANYDYGIPTDNYVIGELNLAGTDYETPQQRLLFIENLDRNLIEIPEVNSSSIVTAPPGINGLPGTYELEDRDVTTNNQLPPQQTIWVKENYFDAVGIRPLSGRVFDSTDTATSEPVVLVSQEFANLLWPDDSAIGQRIKNNIQNQEQWLTIVGVIPKLLQEPIPFGAPPSIYRPITQDTPNNLFLIVGVDSQTEITNLEQQISTAIADADRNIPVINLRTLNDHIYIAQGAINVIALIFTIFSAGVLILASTGIYGVIARSISLKTCEIGVRRALGSSNFHIISLFVMQGVFFLILGTLIGGGSAYIVVANIASLLNINNAVAVLQSISFVVILALALLVTAASYIPARKAVSLEPGDALRYE